MVYNPVRFIFSPRLYFTQKLNGKLIMPSVPR